MLSLTDIHSIDDWKNLLETTNNDILIFKYSPRCSISRSVERGFDQWMSAAAADHLTVVKINVVSDGPLSRHIAQELDIRHESPQAIWLNADQSVKWHASHYDVDKSELDEMLSGN